MHSAAKAYSNTARQTANERELEADLLLKAAARLQSVYDSWEQKRAELPDALLYNRKLWTIFLTDVTGPDHPLPSNIRQNVANLGLFVIKQTLSITADPKRDQLGSLININRQIAAGLRGQAA
jgi:flagellar biosynthesis activator protein FlaF